MPLTALSVCADAEAFQIVSRILEDLGITVEPCGSPSVAGPRLRDQHFDAIVLDCHDEPAALDLLAQTRKSERNRETIVIAIVQSQNQARQILSHGGNFVLYKPISHERVLHSIRAARSLMRDERRHQPRIPVAGPAKLSFAAEENIAADLIDLSSDGMAFRSERKLPPSSKVYFEFALPNDKSTVRLSGEVMWQDSSGRAGIRFAHVPQASRRILQAWLKEAGLNRTVTPTTSAPAAAQQENPSVRLSAGLGLLSGSASDRRNRSRHACCIGAEVYKMNSSVPSRCSLSDISTGGCYVETSEPFASGTAIEVAVRTAELKLRIFGKVQSMHPGFGMGVQFSLKTEEQQEQVRQLLAFAQTPPKLIT